MSYNYEIIFWDFDGVIKESVKLKNDAYHNIFKSFGEEIVKRIKSDLANGHGGSRFEKIPMYLQWAGLNIKSNLQDYLDRYNQLVFNSVISSDWVPGVRSFLDAHQCSFQTLVTATPQLEIDQILESLSIKKYFRSIYGSPISKHQALSIELKKYKADPDKCIFIGDMPSDLAVSEALGIPFLLRRHADNTLLFSEYDGPYIEDFLNYE